MNLTNPMKNVISMRLSSMEIPNVQHGIADEDVDLAVVGAHLRRALGDREAVEAGVPARWAEGEF